MSVLHKVRNVRQIFNVLKTHKACMSAAQTVPNQNPDIHFNKVRYVLPFISFHLAFFQWLSQCIKSVLAICYECIYLLYCVRALWLFYLFCLPHPSLAGVPRRAVHIWFPILPCNFLRFNCVKYKFNISVNWQLPQDN